MYGNNSIAKVYGDDGCNNVAGTILINTPYFNKFYDSYECEDYKGKVPYCTKQFTSVNVTKDLYITLEQSNICSIKINKSIYL